MPKPRHPHPDAPILDEISDLVGSISDARTKTILKSVIDAVALNPQPLPPDPPPDSGGSGA